MVGVFVHDAIGVERGDTEGAAFHRVLFAHLPILVKHAFFVEPPACWALFRRDASVGHSLQDGELDVGGGGLCDEEQESDGEGHGATADVEDCLRLFSETRAVTFPRISRKCDVSESSESVGNEICGVIKGTPTRPLLQGDGDGGGTCGVVAGVDCRLSHTLNLNLRNHLQSYFGNSETVFRAVMEMSTKVAEHKGLLCYV